MKKTDRDQLRVDVKNSYIYQLNSFLDNMYSHCSIKADETLKTEALLEALFEEFSLRSKTKLKWADDIEQRRFMGLIYEKLNEICDVELELC